LIYRVYYYIKYQYWQMMKFIKWNFSTAFELIVVAILFGYAFFPDKKILSANKKGENMLPNLDSQTHYHNHNERQLSRPAEKYYNQRAFSQREIYTENSSMQKGFWKLTGTKYLLNITENKK
jgi:hypothetical protein